MKSHVEEKLARLEGDYRQMMKGQVSERAPSRLVACPDCGREVSRMAGQCPGCGRPMAAAHGSQASACSRGAFIILGLVFGFFGFHNFYAGHYAKGALKIVLSVVFLVGVSSKSLAALLVLAIMLVWVIVELVYQVKDAKGLTMR